MTKRKLPASVCPECGGAVLPVYIPIENGARKQRVRGHYGCEQCGALLKKFSPYKMSEQEELAL